MEIVSRTKRDKQTRQLTIREKRIECTKEVKYLIVHIYSYIEQTHQITAKKDKNARIRKLNSNQEKQSTPKGQEDDMRSISETDNNIWSTYVGLSRGHVHLQVGEVSKQRTVAQWLVRTHH